MAKETIKTEPEGEGIEKLKPEKIVDIIKEDEELRGEYFEIREEFENKEIPSEKEKRLKEINSELKPIVKKLNEASNGFYSKIMDIPTKNRKRLSDEKWREKIKENQNTLEKIEKELKENKDIDPDIKKYLEKRIKQKQEELSKAEVLFQKIEVKEEAAKKETAAEKIKGKSEEGGSEKKEEAAKWDISSEARQASLENLNATRAAYIAIDREYKQAKEEEKSGLVLIEKKLEEAKNDYEKAKADYAKRVYLAKLKFLQEKSGLHPQDAKYQEELRNFNTDLFNEIIIYEHNKLAKEKVDALEPRKRGWCVKLLENYAKMPMWKKILVSAGISTGLAGIGAIGGGLAVAGATAVASLAGFPLRFALGKTFGALGVLTGGLIKITGTRRIERYRQREIETMNSCFATQIEAKEKEKLPWDKNLEEFRKIIGIYDNNYQNLTSRINRRHRHLNRWATGTGLAVGLAGIFLTAPFATQIGEGLYLPGYGAVHPGIEHYPAVEHSTDITHPGIENIQNKEVVLNIGDRGPEGTIIDYFRENPDMAKNFGWDGHSDLSHWAGTKAHLLWLDQAKEALKDPKTLEQLKNLGYEQNIQGYEEMMRRISEGNVNLNLASHTMNLSPETHYLPHVVYEVPITHEHIPPQVVPAIPEYQEVPATPVQEGISEGIPPAVPLPHEISLNEEILDEMTNQQGLDILRHSKLFGLFWNKDDWNFYQNINANDLIDWFKDRTIDLPINGNRLDVAEIRFREGLAKYLMNNSNYYVTTPEPTIFNAIKQIIKTKTKAV